MIKLPQSFLARPIAHRALHGDAGPENSMGAIKAAVANGYGIEIDVQPSADNTPMVFHDETLDRMTARKGPISALGDAALRDVTLVGQGGSIPTLREVLSVVDGRVPLLIEIKDQDGGLGENIGVLSERVARDLSGYTGDVAVMSFNPHTMFAFAKAAPQVPRGLVTAAFHAEHWPDVPAATRARLAGLPDVDPLGAAFISHERTELGMAPVRALKAAGLPILCWTVRTAAQETEARKIADQITFEGYTPA